jgi:hypothetical protein
MRAINEETTGHTQTLLGLLNIGLQFSLLDFPFIFPYNYFQFMLPDL